MVLYGKDEFSPRTIVFQILSLQAIFYIMLGAAQLVLVGTWRMHMDWIYLSRLTYQKNQVVQSNMAIDDSWFPVGGGAAPYSGKVTPKSLFEWKATVGFDTFQGYMVAGSYGLTSLFMSIAIWKIVKRMKKCADFCFTVYFVHFASTCVLSGFPLSIPWCVFSLQHGDLFLICMDHVSFMTTNIDGHGDLDVYKNDNSCVCVCAGGSVWHLALPSQPC